MSNSVFSLIIFSMSFSTEHHLKILLFLYKPTLLQIQLFTIVPHKFLWPQPVGLVVSLTYSLSPISDESSAQFAICWRSINMQGTAPMCEWHSLSTQVVWASLGQPHPYRLLSQGNTTVFPFPDISCLFFMVSKLLHIKTYNQQLPPFLWTPKYLLRVIS